jgi:steroid Delta-isomerase
MTQAIDRLVAFYEHIRPETLPELRELYAADARFKDPFNDVTGHDAIVRIFEHMFSQVDRPAFRVMNRLGDGRRAVLELVFSFSLSGRAFEVCGASLLLFDDVGRVSMHRDYWDPSEELYAKLPCVGGLFRWLRRRMSATLS